MTVKSTEWKTFLRRWEDTNRQLPQKTSKIGYFVTAAFNMLLNSI